ncbi:hypothetical protein XENTR_v10024045 [Xenopus tropicalis]|uniref:Uncharacterized protein LOC100486021 n=1 Tax=Xenopus tropicalis TaxID=8364 RepID=A0A8J0QIS7_XENTR|nr:uncharacterized protein LOC100486021 [Xenopus tropicalis]KAE8579458.1 hypothetical protein XENTR_v10024045 [Xenopus tropicalis]
MSTRDSDSSTEKMSVSSAEGVAEKKWEAAQSPSERDAERGVKCHASDVAFNVIFNLPSLSTAFTKELSPTTICKAQLLSGVINVTLSSSNSNFILPPSSINAPLASSNIAVNLPAGSVNSQSPSERPKDSKETDVEGNISNTVTSLHSLPTAACNAQLSSDRIYTSLLSNVPLITSNNTNLPSGHKNPFLQRGPSKATGSTDQRNSPCPISKNNASLPLDSHSTDDIGPLSQVSALIDQLVHTHSAILGNEATLQQSEGFLLLIRDILKQGIEAEKHWHQRIIEDRQHHRIAKLEMAQMQVCYSKSGSLSPPFSEENFPQFQDVNEFTDWVLLNFEKLCAMYNVPEPEWVCFLPDRLKSKAMGCYCDVPMNACQDYKIIKAALLKPYDIEPEIHRVKFRNMVRNAEESFTSFYQRLQYRYKRWMDTSNVKKFKDCYKPLVLEQLLQTCPAEVKQTVLNQEGCTPYQAAKIADESMQLHPKTAAHPKLKKRCAPPKIDGKIDDFLQYFVADNENILDLLDLFECRCMFQNLPKSRWVKCLYRKLKGKVLDVCLSVPQEHKHDYDFVKAEILKIYAITPKTHLKKFRTIQHQADQTFTVFYQSLLCHYNRWMEAYAVKTFGQCTNLIVVEQLLTQCPPDVQRMIKQRALTPEAAARIADEYLIIHPNLQKNQNLKKQLSEVPLNVRRPTQVTFQDEIKGNFKKAQASCKRSKYAR